MTALTCLAAVRYRNAEEGMILFIATIILGFIAFLTSIGNIYFNKKVLALIVSCLGGTILGFSLFGLMLLIYLR